MKIGLSLFAVAAAALLAVGCGVVSVYSGVAIPAAVKDGVTAGRRRSAAQGESFL